MAGETHQKTKRERERRGVGGGVLCTFRSLVRSFLCSLRLARSFARFVRFASSLASFDRSFPPFVVSRAGSDSVLLVHRRLQQLFTDRVPACFTEATRRDDNGRIGSAASLFLQEC